MTHDDQMMYTRALAVPHRKTGLPSPAPRQGHARSLPAPHSWDLGSEFQFKGPKVRV